MLFPVPNRCFVRLPALNASGVHDLMLHDAVRTPDPHHHLVETNDGNQEEVTRPPEQGSAMRVENGVVDRTEAIGSI